MMAADVANVKFGDNQYTMDSGRVAEFRYPKLTQGQAAKVFNISLDSVKQAVRLKKSALPEVIAAIRHGTMTLNEAIEQEYAKKKGALPASARTSV